MQIRVIDDWGLKCAVLETKSFLVCVPFEDTESSKKRVLRRFRGTKKQFMMFEGLDYLTDILINVLGEEIPDDFAISMFWEMYINYKVYLNDLNICDNN